MKVRSADGEWEAGAGEQEWSAQGTRSAPAQGGMLGRVTDLDNGSSERVCGKEKRRGYGLFLTEGMQHQKRGGKEG